MEPPIVFPGRREASLENSQQPVAKDQIKEGSSQPQQLAERPLVTVLVPQFYIANVIITTDFSQKFGSWREFHTGGAESILNRSMVFSRDASNPQLELNATQINLASTKLHERPKCRTIAGWPRS